MISVIPQPEKATPQDGNFKFNEQVRIVIRDENIQPEANYLAEWIERSTGYRIPMLTEQQNISDKTGIILLSLNAKNETEDDEGYRLQINPEKIEISAGSNRGKR